MEGIAKDRHDLLAEIAKLKLSLQLMDAATLNEIQKELLPLARESIRELEVKLMKFIEI